MPSKPNTTHTSKRTNIPKEKKKLLVVSYLMKLGKDRRANKNQIAQSAQENSQQRGDYGKILSEMVAMDWIEYEEREDNLKWYTTTQNGRDALEKAKKLVNDKHPLAELEIFQDLLDF